MLPRGLHLQLAEPLERIARRLGELLGLPERDATHVARSLAAESGNRWTAKVQGTRRLLSGRDTCEQDRHCQCRRNASAECAVSV
jgi:hypothetical protein